MIRGSFPSVAKRYGSSTFCRFDVFCRALIRSMFARQLLSPGFLAILLHKEYGEEAEKHDDGEEDEEERTIPEFDEGEIIPLLRAESSSAKVTVAVGAPCWASLTVKERMTTPPSYLTESELITLMEKNCIGKLSSSDHNTYVLGLSLPLTYCLFGNARH